MELQEIKKKLHDIFVYYAQFGDRLNTVNLKSQTFHRMLKDANIYSSVRASSRQDSTESMSDTGFTKKRADLIFCSVNRNKTSMVFDVFL